MKLQTEFKYINAQFHIGSKDRTVCRVQDGEGGRTCEHVGEPVYKYSLGTLNWHQPYKVLSLFNDEP